jgi:hypothetical protein
MRDMIAGLARRIARPERPPQAECGCCRHFRNDAATIEATFAGLSSLSSATASVRADDGVCTLRDIYLSAAACCPRFSPDRS